MVFFKHKKQDIATSRKRDTAYFFLVSFLILLFPLLPLYKENFDKEALLFLFGFFSVSVSSFSLLKSLNKFSFLRTVLLISPGIFFLAYFVPVLTDFRGLSADDIMMVLQTNIPEATGYLIGHLKFIPSIFSLFIFFLFIYLSVVQNRNKNNLISSKIVAFILLIVGAILMYGNINNPLTKPIYEAIPNIKEYRDFFYNLQNREKITSLQEETQKGIYVVIIGESQNRNRMSVYGYTHHNTTPFLSEMANNEHWFFFDNIYSCHVQTIPALTYALTQKNSYNILKLPDSYSLPEVLNKFNTYWISNQKEVAAYGEPVTEIGLKAKYSIFTNKSFIEQDPYDEVILDVLPNENDLKDTSVIFIHLMGQHDIYEDRYPKEFDKWSDAYDNSILYNDYIIRKIYEHFSSMKDFMALVYFSDHADDLRCSCHGIDVFTWPMIEIPLYAYFSDKYMESYPEKIKAAKNNLHSPFTNDMFFDTFLGILNVTDERFYVPQNDMLSLKYNHIKKDLLTGHGKYPLSWHSIMKKPTKFKNKSWLFRVNSPQKLLKLGKKYAGVELDIVFHTEANDFENSDRIIDLKMYPLSNTLEAYKKLNNKPSLWLDFKNLTDGNKSAAENRLDYLVNKTGINKNKVLVESGNYNALEYFTKRGWQTSYYLPLYDFQKMKKDEVEEKRKLTEKIASSGKVSAISFAREYYDFIKQLNLRTHISLYTWVNTTLDEFITKPENLLMFYDPAIKAFLFIESSKYDR